jgi:hypothetical protein
LQQSLHNSGLPDLKEINNLTMIKMKELQKEIIDGTYSSKLKCLLSIGRENFTHRGVWGETVLSMENLSQTSIILPPVVLGDGYTTPIVSNTIPTNSQDIEEWINAIIKIEVSIDRFIHACRL